MLPTSLTQSLTANLDPIHLHNHFFRLIKEHINQSSSMANIKPQQNIPKAAENHSKMFFDVISKKNEQYSYIHAYPIFSMQEMCEKNKRKNNCRPAAEDIRKPYFT